MCPLSDLWGASKRLELITLLKESILRGDAGKLFAASCEAGQRLGSAGRKPGRADLPFLWARGLLTMGIISLSVVLGHIWG